MNIKVKFATSNQGKLREIRALLSEFNIEVEDVNLKKFEIQCEEITEIAEFAVIDLNNRYNISVAVEDSGLHISALKNFPGPYSSFVYKTLNLEGILKLLKNIDDRTAYFESVVAYAKTNRCIKIFRGITWGRISLESRGDGGFGFDPIFIPNEQNDKTFAEMSLDEKNRLSHRGKAVKKFGLWISVNNA